SWRLRMRPRTRRGDALQRPGGCEMRGAGSRTSDGGPLEDLDAVALAELDDRLLPTGLAPAAHAAALRLRLHLDDVHAENLHVEELFDRVADLRLVRALVHAERVLVLLDQAVALLGHDRGDQDLPDVHQLTISCTRASAVSLTRSERAQTSAPTSSSAGS